MARPDEVRRCCFSPYRCSRGSPGPASPAGTPASGAPRSRSASAASPPPCPVTAPCQEGDRCQRCFHLLCVIPRALPACRRRSGQGSARTGSPRGKVGQPRPAQVTGLQLQPFPFPLLPPQSGVKRMLWPRSGAREALRNLLLLHRGCVDVPGRPLRALSAAAQRRPFPWDTSSLPGPLLTRAVPDAGTAEGLVTKATCSRLTPEPEGGDSRWQQESSMVKQGMSWDKSGT